MNKSSPRPKKKRGLARATPATRKRVAMAGGFANTKRHQWTEDEARDAALRRWYDGGITKAEEEWK